MACRRVREWFSRFGILESKLGITVRIDLGAGIHRAIARRAVFGHLNAQLAWEIVREWNNYLCDPETRMRATAKWWWCCVLWWKVAAELIEFRLRDADDVGGLGLCTEGKVGYCTRRPRLLCTETFSYFKVRNGRRYM